MDSVIDVAIVMGKFASQMKIPLIYTEHNPTVFGKTFENVIDALPKDNCHKFDKTKFSMITPDIAKTLQSYNDRKSVILYGIEGHICVQQTCLDLLQLGYDVHLLADGISSSRTLDRSAALERQRNVGAFVTTSESVMFEILDDSKSVDFKPCLKLIKERDTKCLLGTL